MVTMGARLLVRPSGSRAIPRGRGCDLIDDRRVPASRDDRPSRPLAENGRSEDAVPVAGGLGPRRTRHQLLVLAKVVVVALAVAGVIRYSSLLGDALARLADLRWAWMGPAVAGQVASLVLLARLQQRLLHRGGTRMHLKNLFSISLVANAIGTSMPAGPAWAGGWTFSRLTAGGASRSVAARVVLLSGAVSYFVLFLLVAVGAQLAGSSGPTADLRWPATAVAGAALGGTGLVWSARARSILRVALRPLASRLGGVARWLVPIRERVSLPAGRDWRIRLSGGDLVWAACLAAGQWVAKIASLAASIWAVGASVPWPGLVLAYGASQVPAGLAITPGGIGLVEGALALGLHSYGASLETAVSAALLYRLVSFWSLVPLGWTVWARSEVRRRRCPAGGDKSTDPVGLARLADRSDSDAAGEACQQCPAGIASGSV